MPRGGKKKMDKIFCEFNSNSAADEICSDLKTFLCDPRIITRQLATKVADDMFGLKNTNKQNLAFA